METLGGSIGVKIGCAPSPADLFVDSFQSVTVWINDKSGVVVRPVVRANAWLAVIRGTVRDSSCMKPVDGFPRRSGQCQMEAISGSDGR